MISECQKDEEGLHVLQIKTLAHDRNVLAVATLWHPHTGGLQEAESFADITFGSTLALGGTSHSLDIVYRAQRLASFLVLPEISYLLDGNSDLGPGPEAMLRCLSLF